MSQPIKSPCNKQYQLAYRTSGLRKPSDITVIVMHDTESPDKSAGEVAAYFHGPSAEGSAHLCVDSDNCYRCLPDVYIPWAAANANGNGFHIEQCGFASWPRVTWRKKHRRTIQRAAYKAAVHCHKFKIPPVFINYEGLARGQKGVTTHAEVSKYSAMLNLPGDHSHTDPGANWPRWLFMFLLRRYHKQLGANR